MSMRIATMKDEEGNIIPKLAGDLENVGVSATDANGQIRDTYGILYDLSKVWKDLDKNTQMSLLDKLAGKRQGNILASVLSDTKEIEKAFELTSNSTGSAREEFEKYKDSIQYSIDQMKEQLNGLYSNLVDDASLKSMINIFGEAIGIVSELVDTFGLIPLTISTIVTALNIFSTKFRDSFANQLPLIKNINAWFEGFKSEIVANTAVQDKNTASTVANTVSKNVNSTASKSEAVAEAMDTTAKATNTTATVANTVATGALTIALTALQSVLTFGLSIAITSGIALIGKFIDKIYMSKEELEEFNSEMVLSSKEMKASIADANKYISEIERINKALSETSDIEKRTKLQEELNKSQQGLAEAMPESITSIDIDGNMLSENVELAKQIVDLKKDELELDAKKFFETNEGLSAEIEGMKEKRNQLKLMQEAQAKGDGQYTYTHSFNRGNEVLNEVITKSFDTDDIADLNKEIQETTLKMSQASSMAELLGDSMDSSTSKVMNSIKDYNLELEMNSLKALESSDSQETLKDVQESLKKAIEETNSALKEYGETFDALSGSIDIIDKVTEEYKKYGGITDDTYSNLLSKYPDVFREMTKEGDMIGNLTNLKKQYQKEQKTQLEQAWKTATDEKQLINDQMANEIEAYNQTADKKVQIDQNKKISTADMVNFITSSTSRMNNSLAGMYGEDSRNWSQLLSSKLETFNDFIRQVLVGSASIGEAMGLGVGAGASKFASNKLNVKLPNLITSPPSIVNGSDKNSKKDQTYTPTLEAFYKLNQAIDDVNDALSLNRVKQENAFGMDKKKLLDEEVKLLEKQKDLYSQLMGEQSNKISQIRSQLTSLGATFDSVGNITNYESLLGKTATGEKAVENLKALEKLVSDYTSLSQSELPKTREEWEKLDNEIKNSYKEMAKTVADMEKDIYEIIEAYEEKKTKKKISEIQKQIDAENKRYEAEKQEEDLTKKNKQLAELKAEMDKFAFATDELGKAKFEQLKKQYEEARDELNQTIKDQKHEDSITDMEDEITNLEKDLEDFLNSDEIDKIISDAMKTGVVQIGDEVIKLDDAMTDFYKNSIVGQESLNQKMKEMREIMETVKELSKNLPEINNQANISQIKSVPQIASNYGANVSDKNKGRMAEKVEINISIPISGDATDETINKMKKVVKTEVKEAIKQYDKTFKK